MYLPHISPYTSPTSPRYLPHQVRLGAEEAREWQRAAAPFVCLYVVGIPLAFAAILRRHLSPTSPPHLPDISPASSLDLAHISPMRRYGVRPALLDTHDHAQGAATLQWERRCLQRFSLLYAKYKPQRYWYLVRVRARLRLSLP